jgi:AraC family transcriptional regulator
MSLRKGGKMNSRKPPQTTFRHGKSVQAISAAGFRVVERLYPPNLQVPQHLHKDAHLVVTLRGKYLQRSSGKDLEFEPGTVGFYPAGETHSSSYSPLGARSLHIDIDPETFDRAREASPGFARSLVCRGGKPASISGEIYRECRSPDAPSPLVLEGLIFQLFGEICRVPMQRRHHLPTWLSRADGVIRERFTETLTLSDIAGYVGVHPVHLAREYRKHYRSTVGEQIRRLRVDFARRQISTTESTLADIALASGFSDQSHFTVAFKNYVGIPPSVYRRSLRQSRGYSVLDELSAVANPSKN